MKRTILALVFAPAFSALAAAQAPEQSSFYLILRTDTILSERVTRTPSELKGEFADRVRGGRVAYIATLAPDAQITKMSALVFKGSADTVGDNASFTVAGDQMVIQLGTAAPVKVPAVVGAMPIVNPSVGFIEQVVIRAKATNAGNKVAIPLFIAGAPQPVPAMVTLIGTDSAQLEYAGVTMKLAISPEGRVLSGAVPAQQIRITRGPAAAPVVAEKRDYAAPADAPYTAEEVKVRTPAGFVLAGTLTVPKARKSGGVPAVVMITGSGPEDRDERSAGLPATYRPFREIADTLGRRGIAVLRLDDRGVGGSDLGTVNPTSVDFAEDIRAAVAYLRTRPEIDGARVGLVGHSEGGVIAPMVAETDPKLRAMVLMAATASPGRAILLSQQHYMVDTVMKLTGERRDAALAQYQRNTDSLAKSVGWLQWFITHDPSETARRVRTPVLILQGYADHQVPSSEAEKLYAAFKAAGNPSVSVHMFEHVNHLFVNDTIGSFSYEKLPSLAVRKDVLGSIADWLSEKFR